MLYIKFDFDGFDHELSVRDWPLRLFCTIASYGAVKTDE